MAPVAAKAPVAGNDSCGYSDATFNENTIMRVAQVYGSGLNATIGAFANDEKGMLLGVNGATPTTSSPDHAVHPALGDKSLTDPSGRPYYPALYLTNITSDPSSTSGDFQNGGTPIAHVDDVFGAWTTATVAGGNFTDTLPSAKNNWNLGAGADTPPAGTSSFDEGYSTEVRWNANGLGLQPGNTYRIQILVHDGDQNKAGGDAGEYCVTLTIPGTPLVAKKVVDKTSANPGDTLTYTITIQNSNSADVTGVDITDDISAVVPTWGTLTGSNPSATVTGGNQLAWLNQTIPANGTATYKYFVTLASSGWPAGTTTLPNVVVATKTNCVAGSADPNCKTTTTVTPAPHITVTKTPDAQTVVAGHAIGFTLTVKSDGLSTATNVVLNDPLPTLANASINWGISPNYTGPGNCGINGVPPSETLNCSFGDMAPGATATIHLTSNTSAPGAGVNLDTCQLTVETYATNVNNQVNVTSGNAVSATAHAGICVTGNPHVTVTKTADAPSVVAGNPVGFTITVKSDGVGTANDVNLSDPLPTLAGAGINWTSTYTGQGTCGIAGAPPSETLSCAFGNIASGTTLSVHVTSATTAPVGGASLAACQIGITTYATNLDNTVSVTSANAGSGQAQTGICVTGTPHIKVVKTPDAQTVVAGNPVGFSITVTSDGVGTANGVSLNDPLPTLANAAISWSISPANADCAVTGGAPQTLSCAFGNLDSGQSRTVHVTSATTAPTGGATLAGCVITVATYATNLDNTVNVTSTNASSATAQTGICVVRPPHVIVTKTPDAATVVAGNPVGFTMTVTNDGVGTATGVALNDALPTLANAGISWSISPAVAGCSITGAAPSQSLACTIGNLLAGGSFSVHVSSPTTAPGVGIALSACAISVTTYATNLDNTVNVTSTNAGTATAQTGVCVTGNPHVSVTKTADAPTVQAGNPLGFTITVKSDGVGTVTNVTLNDPLPTLAGLGISWSISPAYTGQGSCGINGAAPTQTLVCSFGDMTAGTTLSVHLASASTAPAGGTTIAPCVITTTTYATNLDNTVTITSSNAGSAIAKTGICIPQQPHLVVTKTADATTVAAGSAVGFTITVKNDGTGTATGVSLTDPLPTLPGLGISWSISPAYAGLGTCTINGTAPAQTLSCAIGDLPQGGSTSVHVTSATTAPTGGATIAACVITVTTYATNLNNSVNVTSQNAGSATAQTGTCITSSPHVTVTKTPDATSVLAGNPVGFTMTVKSDGNGTATAVTLTDALPTLANAGISWSINPAYAGPGTCAITGAIGSQTLACSFGDLAAGAAASVHVTSPTTAPASGTTLAPCTISVATWATNLNNSVQVTSQSGGSSTAITGTCVTINIVGNIHVVKVANPTLLPVGGGPVTYTYAVTNIGLPPLQNVTAVDDKCSPLVFLGGDTNGDAQLQVGEVWHYSCTAVITVTTVNTVVATGYYFDPNASPTGATTGTTAAAIGGLVKVSSTDHATVVVPNPTPTPSGSVKGATSPPKPHVTLPPTDGSSPLGSSGQSGILMILVLLAGIVASVPILVFGKRRSRAGR